MSSIIKGVRTPGGCDGEVRTVASAATPGRIWVSVVATGNGPDTVSDVLLSIEQTKLLISALVDEIAVAHIIRLEDASNGR